NKKILHFTMTYYKKLQNKIKGPVFSIITPFNEDESIDFKSLENYIQTIHDAKGNIFYVMGYNSRYSQLSWDEIKTINKFVTKKVKELNSNHIVIVADPLHCSTKVSIEFAKHPMGPLALTDLVGLDVRRDILLNLKESFDDEAYTPHPLLEKLIAAGRLGRKSGKGIYDWSSGSAEECDLP
ncbi:MAG TPA: hypothetical protein EYQ80_03100, partial [Candidatus Poseidoniales archaeon]|nr:hypothetical protein [Candidatus Poseidoniales archaeon]